MAVISGGTVGTFGSSHCIVFITLCSTSSSSGSSSSSSSSSSGGSESNY